MRAWRRYILVALIEDDRGEQILKALVPVAEEVLRPSQPLGLASGKKTRR